MRADDLTPLLTQTPTDGLNYAQGTITAWNSTTGENLVSVNGTLLQDLPILNTGEAITLKRGHVVGLVRWKAQWFILGRITIAGSGEFASSSVAFDAVAEQARGFQGPGGFIVNQDVSIPRWASQVIVIVSGMLTMNNTSGLLSNLTYAPVIRLNHVDVAQSFLVGPNTAYIATPADYWSSSAVSYSTTFDVNFDVNKSITTWINVLTTWPAHGDNSATLTTQCIFRSDY